MAGRAAGLIVVIDASTFIFAALKANRLPEQALLRAVDRPNRLILSQPVEDEYREVIFRPKFDRFVSVERRQRILDMSRLRLNELSQLKLCGIAMIRRTTSTWHLLPPAGRM
jgi:predicted nucleic acid-binding protein